MRNRNPNYAMTEVAARRLGPLLGDVVFVGGCATGLLTDDVTSAPVRLTEDVDVIAEIATYGQYASFGERLSAAGFQEDGSEGAPICRWIAAGLRLDVMPTLEGVLGFSNR